MSDAALRFERVGKSYAGVTALADLTLEVRRGEFLALVGVNGAGKTTLIKCLLDFCDLDSGAIEIHGVAHRRPQARARLAFLPERFTAPYFFTGREFIEMMLQLFACRYEEERVRAMFAALDLDAAALDKPVRAYSKGMTQKLGLAACFLSQRDLYVLDEPMSGLDPKARDRAKGLLLKLKSEGRTLLFTSHSLTDIEEVCDRVTVLHGGAMAYAGAPRGLCERHGEASLERAFLKCIEAHA